MHTGNDGLVVILSGPSGSGKNTVLDKLMADDNRICTTVSATTRAPRPGETDGIDYFFITEEEFEKRVANNEFAEHVCYDNHRYGTLKSNINSLIEKGKTVVLVIEVNGAANMRKAYPQSVSVFLMPPSEQVLEKRLKKRETDTAADIAERLMIAHEEMKHRDEYDYIVVNDDLDAAVAEIEDIINNIYKR